MTGLSRVKRASNSASGRPCGCSLADCSAIRSTTLTTRTVSSGTHARRMSTAAMVSRVGTSPAQPSTTSGSLSGSVLAHLQMPAPAAQCSTAGAKAEPLRGGLLARHDDVDVVAAAQAVVGGGEQAVGIGGQVDANDLGLLVDDVVDEARVLVTEAVVVLAPYMRGEEIVEGGDGAPPGDLARDLEPLGVLVEHR